MSEFDIESATRNELMAQADTLGLEYSGRASKGELQKIVADALGIAFEAEADLPKAHVGKTAPGKPKKVWLKIDKSRDDKHPVQIGVNGVLITIDRGHWVHVGVEYAEVLANAITKIINPETKEIEEIYSYPFQVSQDKPKESVYNFNA